MKRSIKGTISQIAMQEGVSEEEVISEIQRVIDEGYDNDDPAISARWEALPFKTRPTPEELIIFLARKI